MSPTALSLRRLRAEGWLACVVERHVAAIDKTFDAFGVADVLAVHPRDRLVLLVQCTSAGHVADRLARVQGRPETALLLRGGVAIEVWGWGRRDDRWAVRRVALRPGDLAAVPVETPRARRARRGERQAGLFDCEREVAHDD